MLLLCVLERASEDEASDARTYLRSTSGHVSTFKKWPHRKRAGGSVSSTLSELTRSPNLGTGAGAPLWSLPHRALSKQRCNAPRSKPDFPCGPESARAVGVSAAAALRSSNVKGGGWQGSEGPKSLKKSHTITKSAAASSGTPAREAPQKYDDDGDVDEGADGIGGRGGKRIRSGCLARAAAREGSPPRWPPPPPHRSSSLTGKRSRGAP
mmetsp:Transcript_81932/g.163640  ORF Transcript_81932/g.163640 Transcript_81932/m.163640 type:complete len:210 (+) Transcript_81932:668-1297(+)